MSQNKKDVSNIAKPDHLFVFNFQGKTVSTLSANIHAHGGAHLAPIAIPNNYCLAFPFNSK